MPYYVFSQASFGRLEKLGEFDAFRDASAHAKQLRRAREESLRRDEPSSSVGGSAGEPGHGGSRPGDTATRIRVIFGEHQLAAEDALLQVRVASPQGDD